MRFTLFVIVFYVIALRDFGGKRFIIIIIITL